MIKIFKEVGTKNSKNVDFQFWRQENQSRELYSEKFSQEKLDYHHNNPVESGPVEKAEDYLLSSTKNYYLNEKVLIDIDYL